MYVCMCVCFRAALLVAACAAEPQASSTAAVVPRIPPPSEQLRAQFPAMEAQRARLLALARERHPHYFSRPDGSTLITLVLDDEG